MSSVMDDDVMPGRSSKSGNNFGVIIFLGLLFLPATILGFSIYMLLRKARQRLSVIGTVVLALLATAAGVFFATDAWEQALAVFQKLDAFTTVWPDLIPLAVVVNLALGALFGFFICVSEVHQMKVNPQRLTLPGNWMHNFKYRRSPLQLLRRKRTIKGLHEGSFTEDDRAPLGLDEETDEVTYRYDTEAAKMTLVSGAAGSGKTITLLSLIRADIKSQKPVFVIDFKRSPEMASKIAAWAEENGSDFYHFVNGDAKNYDVKHSQGQAFYDPLRSGSSTSKADMVLGMREYDTASAVYRNNMQQLLQVAFNMLREARRDHEELKTTVPFDRAGRRIRNMDEFKSRPEVRAILQRKLDEVETARREQGDRVSRFNIDSFLREARLIEDRILPRIDWDNGGIYQLASALSGSNLEALCRACIRTPIEQEAFEFLALLDPKNRTGDGIRHAIAELQGQLRTIIASEYGQWVRQDPEGRNIDVFDLSSQKGKVVLFSLNSDSEPEFARYIGSMILADLTALSAKRRNAGKKNQVNIYVDEFQAVPPTAVTSLLEKARESRMALTLAQQSFEQIIAASSSNGEAYLLSILDTCSNFIIHNGMTEDSATRLAKILGKHWVTVYRQANQNQSFFLSMNWANRRQQTVHTSEEERWVFEPRQFMKLSSPDKNNSFKSTAVVVNKTSADERFKDRQGALARTVWMIPDGKVLDEYYTPSFDAGEAEERYTPEPLAEEPLQLVDEPEFTPYDDGAPEPEFSYQDASQEEEEGDFAWSEDEEATGVPVQEDYEAYSEELAVPQEPAYELPPVEETPLQAPQRQEAPPAPAERPSSFSSLYSSDFKPERVERRTARSTPPAAPQQKPAPQAPEPFDPDTVMLPDL